MKKTYDRKVFKRKLLSDRRTVIVTIQLFMILLLGFPLLTRAGTVDPGHRRIGLKMAGFGLFSRRGLSDYAVTEISQYVWTVRGKVMQPDIYHFRPVFH